MALIQRAGQQDRTLAQSTAAGPSDVPLHRCDFRAMGTSCFVQYATTDASAGAAYEAAVRSWVTTFEARYTRFRDDSIVGRINLAAGNGQWIEIDAEMERMLEMAGMVHFMTRGIVDSTAGPLARLWDYHTPHPVLPSESVVKETLALVGWSKVEREPGRVRLPRAGMSLDFGGWGKELAVDSVTQLAGEHGIHDVLVDFGHDIRVTGKPPGRPAWHVGLEDPFKSGALWGSIGLSNMAVASSGDYQRGFTVDGQRYGHILDPRTGRPVTNGLRQVTVVATSCLQAGMLATAAFVEGPIRGLDLIQETMGAEGCMVSSHAKHQTRGFFNHVVS